ncbi:unnamed protein product [Ostreobium quekettii]|uniref:Uncharacterized protein n=1 Tax=Ostreobium quekettii TaxID=121088 RepID=A0A8S1INT0_9CHLO|nr:unnamed protein product [Ostreobium quekettii]
MSTCVPMNDIDLEGQGLNVPSCDLTPRQLDLIFRSVFISKGKVCSWCISKNRGPPKAATTQLRKMPVLESGCGVIQYMSLLESILCHPQAATVAACTAVTPCPGGWQCVDFKVHFERSGTHLLCLAREVVATKIMVCHGYS